MVSLKEIARMCGVSTATVSKALNNKEDIAKATRDRIQKKAQEMGYMQDASARALRTKRTYNIGVLYNDTKNAGLAHEYFSSILESFKKTAESCGYDITFITHTIDGKESTYLKHCEYRSFDGVAVILADFTNPEILELVHSDLPVVTIDYIYDDCPAVVSDNTRGLQELVRFAVSRGHRRFAYIHGEMTEVTRNRLMGFYSACRVEGIEAEEQYILQSDYHDIGMCAEKTRELLAMPDVPDCIIFPDDYSYLGAMQVLAEKGLTPGKDISVMSYDGINMAKAIGLTTYEQDTNALGTIACRRLIEVIENPDTIVEHSVVMGKLVEGKTVVQKQV